MVDLFDGYPTGASGDEAFSAPDETRRPYEAVLDALRPLGNVDTHRLGDPSRRGFSTARRTASNPTNAIPAGDRHVIVGHGREYGDVAPFKGLYSGSASSTLEVTVQIARLF